MYTKISAVRKRASMSQSELAAASKVSQAHISKMETGAITNSTHEKIQRIADALGVNANELIDTPEVDVNVSLRALNQGQQQAAVYIPLHNEYHMMNDELGHDGFVIRAQGGAQTQIRKPSFLDYSADCYAAEKRSDEMEPRYFSGDILFIDPQSEVRPGDDCVLMFQIKKKLVGIFREVVSINDEEITCKDLKSGNPRKFFLHDLHGVHLVVGSQRARR